MCVGYVSTSHAKVPCSLQGSAASLRVEFTDNAVCWVAHQSTEHSSYVPPSEGDHQLGWLAHLVTGDWNHVLV